MTKKYILLLILFFTGCAIQGNHEIYDKYSLVPISSDNSLSQWVKGDPFNRIDEFENKYRNGTDLEPLPNFLVMDEYISDLVGMLAYPTSTRKQAPWEYINAARDFAAIGNLGGAIRSFWSALTLSSKTIASRAEKEMIRYTAYKGLADLAKYKGQPNWAQMLDFCAELAYIYLKSEQAQTEHSSFYHEVARIKQAQLEIDEQKSNLARVQAQQDRQAMIAVLGAFAQGMSSASSMSGMSRIQMQQALAKTQLEMIQKTMPTMMALKDASSSMAEANRLIEKIAASHGGKIIDFRNFVADDVTEVEAGNSFISKEVLMHLMTAANQSPYLESIKKFSFDKPTISNPLLSYDSTEGSIIKLAEGFKAYEVYVAKTERRNVYKSK